MTVLIFHQARVVLEDSFENLSLFCRGQSDPGCSVFVRCGVITIRSRG
jgi:hypothetical protein